MKFFYISNFPNEKGQFLIHSKNCSAIPDILDREYLGPFNSGIEALGKGKMIFPTAVCCDQCCKSDDFLVSTTIKDNFLESKE